MPQPLAVQLYSFREAIAADRPKALARTASLGFRYVEPFGLGDPNTDPATRIANAEAFRADLDAAGLKACSTHAFAPLGENADVVLDELDALGTDILIAPSPGLFPGLADTNWESNDDVKRFAEAVNTAAENAGRRGKKFGFHNHWSELAVQPDGTTGLERMYSFTDPDVLAEVDLYWVNVGGQVPADIVSRIGSRVNLVHAKDGPGTLEQRVTDGRGGHRQRRQRVGARGRQRHRLAHHRARRVRHRRVRGSPGRRASGSIDDGYSSWEA